MAFELKEFLGRFRKNSFKNLFKSEQSVLGVDIGSSSIKIVQLRKEKERAILETYGEVATGPYGGMEIGQPVKLNAEKTAEAIRDVLKEAGAKATVARVAIPLNSSFVKVIQLPVSAEGDLENVITIEARRHVPVPISEVSLDWWVMPKTEKEKEENNKTMEVILVAIHNDVINTYKDIIAKSGLVAAAYEMEPFGMIRAAIGRGSSTIAVIDFGASSTKMAILDYGVMRESHFINKGSHDLTRALSQSMGIDLARAEEIKREVGLSDLPEHKEIMEVMQPILSYIFHEANASLKNFQSKYKRSVSKIVFTGGGGLLKGIVPFGVKEFTIEVELADPFSKTEHPVFLSTVLKEIGLSFSVASGLALGEL